MKNIKKWIWALCMTTGIIGCTPKYDHKGKTPLVGIDGHFLYAEDMRLVLPLNLTSEDSTLFVERYIRNWIEETLLFDKAEGNIPDSKRIADLVENYRKSLILHTYQKELVDQKLEGSITDEEIAAYYDNNPTLFLLEEPVVKGLFIKVPLRSPGLSDVRKWYKKNTQEAIENIEKYSLVNAVTYDYFIDRWKTWRDIAAVMPLSASENGGIDPMRNRDIELKDTAYHYFLHVEDYLKVGQQKPLDFVKDEIREILKNMKQVEFIEQIKDELYKDASEDNKIIYYNQNTNE